MFTRQFYQMKKLVTCSAFILVLLAACNEKSKPGNVSAVPAGQKETATAAEMLKTAETITNKAETLQQLTSLTADQLKNMFPAVFMSGTQSSFEVQTAMGYTAANAVYPINDSIKVSIRIIDCAGPAGAGIYTTQYLNLADMEKDNEEEYLKAIEFRSNKAFERCFKKTKQCKLTFFTADRLLVNIEGDHLDISAIKTAASQLPLKIN